MIEPQEFESFDQLVEAMKVEGATIYVEDQYPYLGWRVVGPGWQVKRLRIHFRRFKGWARARRQARGVEDRMSETLGIGSTVRLKSGGPVMTVTSMPYRMGSDPHNYVDCEWFDYDLKVVERRFHVEALNTVTVESREIGPR